MRDERGDILPNAHTLGFLRRICKLLYLNIKPIFVFDGSTPALKKKTVAERRRRREQQDARVKRTAEKLLLNRLKQYAVREVAKVKDNDIDHGAEKTLTGANMEDSSNQPSSSRNMGETSTVTAETTNKILIDTDNKETSDESEEDEGFEVNVESGVDPEVLSTLPPSMQLEIMLQLREKAMAAARGGFESRGKKPEEFSQYQMQQYLNSTGLRRKLDAIRGIAQQNSDVAKPVVGEQDKHYVLYKEDQIKQHEKTHETINESVCPNIAHFVPEKTLDISFCVQEDELDMDDMDWEDVTDNVNSGTNVHKQHKSNYWTLSHGFQRGRSLGNWGENPSAHEKETAHKSMTEEQFMVEEAIQKSLREQEELKAQNMRDDEENVKEVRVKSTNTTECSQSKAKREQAKPTQLLDSTVKKKSDGLKKDKSESEMVKPPEPMTLPKCLDNKPAVQSVDDAMAPEGSHVDENGTLPPSYENQKKSEEKKDNVNIKLGSDVDVRQLDVPKVLATSAVTVPILGNVDPNAVSKPRSRTLNGSNILDKIEESREAEASEIAPEIQMQASQDQFDLEQLVQEEAILRADRRAATGQSDSPTEQMFTECQELLQICGIPYIIAPTEAEAQCAWLDANNLVDGVVTDDNDAFLFGARRVYRHIFEESKYVEEYRSEDIVKELGLSRDSLILMALLLGSDYTPGIAGVGIVNAVEIISSFGDIEGLENFKEWVNSVDDDIITLVYEESKLKQGSGTVQEFKQKHKSIRKSWVLPDNFPSQEVIESYKKPALDESKSKFTFISPDFTMLESYCSRRFGWDDIKIRNLFDPVKKSLSQRDKQQTIQGFLSFREKFARVRSKRLAEAVEKVKTSKKRKA